MISLLLCFLSLANVRVRSSVSNGEILAAQHKVVNLPGQPIVGFNHYAGYVKLGHSDRKALFYWFFEAEADPAHKPVVVWLSGGPGCSSVAVGAAQEIGPFLLKGPQFDLNQFSWNKAANMLFLETPVGVGFSYSNNSDDYDRVGDHSTAEDNYAFLVNWFSKFPSYKSNDFYITGESYAGHFAPQLADLIIERNKGATDHLFINLKGIMMGNVVINDPADGDGFVDYAWSHALISDRIYTTIKKECNFTKTKQSDQCVVTFQGLGDVYLEIYSFNIYKPTCVTSNKISSSQLVVHPFQHELFGGQRGKVVAYNPCPDYATAYFNRRDVQLALHANLTKLPYPYYLCSPIITKYIDSPASVLPTIQKLLNAGQRIWIFSGDIDGRVPVTSTRYSLNIMKLTLKEEWRAWFSNHQVAGWVETYQEGLTFATVRGAGHQVPVDKPEEALLLFTCFLSNNSLPASR